VEKVKIIKSFRFCGKEYRKGKSANKDLFTESQLKVLKTLGKITYEDNVDGDNKAKSKK
jgi:hypothetical protein